MRSAQVQHNYTIQLQLEKAAQGVAHCEVSATRVVVDAVLERSDMAVTKLQISPVTVNGFEKGFHQWIQRNFLVVMEAKKLFFEFFLIWIHFAAL